MFSLTRKGPHCLAPIYFDPLLVKAIFSTKSPSWNPRGRAFLSYDLAIFDDDRL